MKRKFKQQISSISTKSICISYICMNSDVCILLINVISMHLLGFLFSFSIISLVQCFHYSAPRILRGQLLSFILWETTFSHKGYSIFCFICMFCRSLFVLLCFSFWPLCCLFVFEIRILNTPLVSSLMATFVPTWFSACETIIVINTSNILHTLCLRQSTSQSMNQSIFQCCIISI